MVDITHSPKPTGDTTAKANSTDPTDLGWQFFGFFKKAHPWPHSTKLKSKIPLAALNKIKKQNPTDPCTHGALDLQERCKDRAPKFQFAETVSPV